MAQKSSCKVQHGTARHSTAQHGTARHSATQHSTAQPVQGASCESNKQTWSIRGDVNILGHRQQGSIQGSLVPGLTLQSCLSMGSHNTLGCNATIAHTSLLHFHLACSQQIHRCRLALEDGQVQLLQWQRSTHKAVLPNLYHGMAP